MRKLSDPSKEINCIMYGHFVRETEIFLSNNVNKMSYINEVCLKKSLLDQKIILKINFGLF